MNYNEVVSSLRSLAREELRLKMVNAVRQDLMELENRSKSNTKAHEENQQRLAKKAAVLNFKLSQLAENDPEREEKLTASQETLKAIAAEQASDNEDFAKLSEAFTKQIAEVSKEIEKIQAGEVKVNKDELEAITNRLISEVTVELAKEVATTVQQAA